MSRPLRTFDHFREATDLPGKLIDGIARPEAPAFGIERHAVAVVVENQRVMVGGIAGEIGRAVAEGLVFRRVSLALEGIPQVDDLEADEVGVELDHRRLILRIHPAVTEPPDLERLVHEDAADVELAFRWCHDALLAGLSPPA
jgi:hypothetical protein